jgi:S-adenosylmethionine hydrolase
MLAMSRIIALATDFGHADSFVGTMKGVILGIAPEVILVDLCHEIPPYDLIAGSLALEAAVGCFPRGAIFLTVVDPGVGGDRAEVAVETERSILVGPDNGVFSLFLKREPARRAVRLTNPAFFRHPVSTTFHGRDVFAPVAAWLATGVGLDEIGEEHRDLVELDIPHPIASTRSIQAHVLAADRFGNLITDLTADDLTDWSGGEAVTIQGGSARIPGVSRTFSDVAPGVPVAYIGSGGRLEIGIREDSAAVKLSLRSGATICVTRAKLRD